MRKIILLMIITIMGISFSSCKTGNIKLANKQNQEKDRATNSVSSASPEGEKGKAEVKVNILKEKPKALEDSNTVVIKGLLDGEEYVEIIVKGEIKNFEHVEIAWDESKNTLVEKLVHEKFNLIKDQNIIIKTYLPDGIPSEKIKWVDQEGKSHEYIFKENMLGE